MPRYDYVPVVHFLVGEVEHDRAQYTDAKHRSYVRQDAHFPQEAIESLRAAERVRLPLADEDAIPDLDPSEPELPHMKRCLLRMLDEWSPELDGERLIAQRFTYLTRRHGFYSAGTVVVERRTNRAVLYYVVVTARITGRGGLLLRVAPEQMLRPRLIAPTGSGFPDTATSTASKIAGDLAKNYLVEKGASITAQAVLGAISGGIATLVLGGIFNLIFPPAQTPNFFDYVPALETIVQQQIENDTMDKINGVFSEIVKLIGAQYQPVRTDDTPLNDSTKNATLSAYLTNYLQTLTEGPEGAMATLQTQEYAQIGFPAFLFGATLHLSLLQEQANLLYFTSKELYDDAIRPSTGSIAVQAQMYASWAYGLSGVWPQIKAARRSQITTQPVTVCQSITPTAVTCSTYIQVDDQGASVTEYVVGTKDDAAQQQADDFVAYYYWPLQLELLAQSLNSPLSMVTTWQTLVELPMGLSAGSWPPPTQAVPISATHYIMIAQQNLYLLPGDMLVSDDEKYRLVYQIDGNLVLSDAAGKQVWTSNTAGQAAWRTYMQADGNFVVYSAADTAVFATGTRGDFDAYAVVTEDGHFQLRSTGDPQTIYWHT